jgi:hypothetical protein
MKESDYLYNVTEALKQECFKLIYPKDDIRRDFYGLIYDIEYHAYTNYISYELSGLIRQGKVLFSEETFNKYKTHIGRLTEVYKVPILSKSFIHSINIDLIVGSWTAFEYSISSMAENILAPEVIEKLLEIQSENIIK